jgi:hypothetical protein
MKRMTVFFLALFLTSGMFAFSAPQIVSSGVDPVTVQPGEPFTLYAEVFDPDGFNDILAVAMFYNDTYLFCLTETDIPGRYEMTFVMPADAPPDTFTLNALAADRNHYISDPYHFSFSISNSKDDSQVSLIAPENGAHFDCSTDITFAWEPYPGTFDAYAFGFFFADGTGIVMPFQNTVTEFTVPGAVWHVLPPGEYFWKVGVFPEIGGPPDAWSDLRSFTVSCHPPSRVFGTIIEIDPDTQTFVLQGRWRNNPEQVIVQVTEETIIHGPDGQPLGFDDLKIQDFALCIGMFENDIFITSHVRVQTPPDPGTVIRGIVTDIFPDQMILTIETFRPDGSIVTVQATEDTVIRGKHGEMPFEDIPIESFAMVKGEWSEDILIADEIFIRHQSPPPPMDVVKGIIHEIDAENHILFIGRPDQPDSVPVHVTPDTVLLGFGGPITFDQIEIGMFAIAEGVWEEDHLIAALVKIRDGEPPPMDVVKGIIHEIDAENHILFIGRPDQPDSVPVHVTPDTVLLGFGGPITFDQIEIGMFAIAEGVWEENHFIAALVKVRDGEPPPPPDFVEGIIHEIDAENHILFIGPPEQPDSVAVFITPDTELIGIHGPITFDQIEIGMFAIAEGVWEEDHFVAFLVHVMPGEPPPPPM